MTLPVTLAASASLGTINLWLGLRIFRMRLRDNVLIGDGGGDLLAGRMRTQANLVEYAPFQRAASGRCDPDMARVGVLGRVGRADCSRCRLMRPHCLSLKGHIMALSLIVLLPAAIAATIPAVPLERKIVSLALANSLTGAAIASCRTVGREAVVAVVDRGGNLVSLQRGDDIGPHNTLAAQRKAFTALSTKASTTVLAERAATDPTSRNLVTIPELLLLGGGMPIVVNGDVIGGIGVAGSGGSANDERCATEAIAQVIGKSRTHP